VLSERGHLDERNAFTLAVDCEQIALFNRVVREVEALPSLFYEGPNGAMCQHPNIKTMREIQPGMAKIRRAWGLTPHDMAMLQVQENEAGTQQPDPEDDEFKGL
jgi:phage terminase small subunit